MPYLPESVKQALDEKTMLSSAAGHLNYVFTREIIEFIKRKGLSYQTINDVVGALESCKLEFYERVARPYENLKIKSNNDVYPESF